MQRNAEKWWKNAEKGKGSHFFGAWIGEINAGLIMSPHSSSWKENFSLLRGWKVMAEVRREGRRRKKGSEGLWKKCWWWGGQTGGGKASKTDGGEGVMAVVQEAKRGKTWYEMVVMRRLTCGGLKSLALVYYVSCGVRYGRTDWSHCRTKGVDCPE